MNINCGRVEIQEKDLLELLGFRDGLGSIHFIGWLDDRPAIGIIIYHPSLPPIPNGGFIPAINIQATKVIVALGMENCGKVKFSEESGKLNHKNSKISE